MLWLGTVGVALNQICFALGIVRTTSAYAALLIALTPLFVLAMAVWRKQEQLTAMKLAGMGLALGGVALLQREGGGQRATVWWGVLFLLLCCATFSVYAVLGKETSARQGPIAMSFWSYVGASLFLLPLLVWEASQFSFSGVSWVAWGCLLYQVAGVSAFCTIFFYAAMEGLSASRVAAFNYIQPVVAGLLAIPILGEPIGANLVAGGALILAGVFVAQLK